MADRCLRPLCFAGPGDEYYGMEMVDWTLGDEVVPRTLRLGLQGSSVLFTYRDAHFAVFTRHQIALLPGETPGHFRERMGLLFILMDDGRDSTNIPLNGFLFAQGEETGDEADFVVGLVESGMLPQYSSAQFFPVQRGSLARAGDASLAAGFPSHLQRVLMETGGPKIMPACKAGAIESREACGVMTYPNDGEPLDGMSGGAIFVTRLAEDGQGFQMFLDGIIQRGGSGYVRYLGIDTILHRIDNYLAGPTLTALVGAPLHSSRSKH